MRTSCLALLVLLVAGVSSATSITPYSFTQTVVPAGGSMQFAPGVQNSLTLAWNFFAIPQWATVVAVDSVEFGLTLVPGLQAQSTFTLELQDTLTTLFGPQLAVNSGTPGPNGSFTFLTTVTDPQVLAAFLADGFVNTLLARDPGPGQLGGSGNSFFLLSSTITVNAEITPEPSTYILIGAGLTGLALLRRRIA